MHPWIAHLQLTKRSKVLRKHHVPLSDNAAVAQKSIRSFPNATASFVSRKSDASSWPISKKLSALSDFGKTRWVTVTKRVRRHRSRSRASVPGVPSENAPRIAPVHFRGSSRAGRAFRSLDRESLLLVTRSEPLCIHVNGYAKRSSLGDTN